MNFIFWSIPALTFWSCCRLVYALGRGRPFFQLVLADDQPRHYSQTENYKWKHTKMVWLNVFHVRVVHEYTNVSSIKLFAFHYQQNYCMLTFVLFCSWSISFYIICDMIKGNESHVGNVQFWVFNTIYLSILNPTFWSKPHYNPKSCSRDMSKSLNL